MMAAAMLMVLVTMVASSGYCEERRIDLSNGYAIANGDAGRIDFYSRDGRQTGWGRLDGTGHRTDMFKPDGVPTGHVMTNPATGRVDLYDSNGRQVGRGRMTPDGRVELFGLDGVQLPDSAVPLRGKR
jgi:hypothetical protein